MKNISASLVLLLFIYVAASAQPVGIGLGTAGFNIKYSPDGPVTAIVRVNPLFTQFPITVNASAMVGHNFIRSNNGHLYVGLGAGTINTEYRSIVEETFWFVNLPVGLEFFPFSDKKVSFAAEAGPRYDSETSDAYPPNPKWRVSFHGLFEFSYYF